MSAKEIKEIEFTREQLRELQLIQLEMLTEVDRICRKNNINYSIDGGTLLGAVRHKGFIPWDDDIDIIMSRKEYERFFEICKTELDTKRFFLQEFRTDQYYRVGYSRLRRNNTIYRRAGHDHMKYHGGVFIDIFVLDNVPNGKVARVFHKLQCFMIRKILWSESGKVIAANAVWRLWFRIVNIVPAKFAFWWLDHLAAYYNRKPTELVRHYTMIYPNDDTCKYGIPADLLNAYTEIQFEGLLFRAVKDYDRYLKMLYGDYMKLPSKEKQIPHIHLVEFRGVVE